MHRSTPLRSTIFSALASTLLLTGVSSCSQNGSQITAGSITQLDDRLASIIDPDAKMVQLADGFTWSEGPVWIEDENYLLFTDVPGNIMWKWSTDDGLSEFLNPSGPPAQDVPHISAPGANGLIMGEEMGHIYVANHGKRAIIAMDLKSKGETILSNNYQGKKFSSPNDLALSSSGKIFFTDPSFGLRGGDNSPDKEQPVNGVYRLDPDGFTHLIIDDVAMPNGIALSPDEKTLYVTDSFGPSVMAYSLAADGTVSNPVKFYDYAVSVAAEKVGAPDGLDMQTMGQFL